MTINGLKNMFIIILITTAIYQTAELWFEPTSNRNFFYTILAQSNQTISQEESILITPSRCIINFGNKSFKIIYPKDSNYLLLSDKIEETVKAAIKSSKTVQSSNLNWNNILIPKSIIYENDYSIPIEALAKSLHTKVSSAISKIPPFDKIIIIPSRTNTENIEIIFIDSISEMAYTCENKKNNTNLDIYQAIETIQQEQNEPLFISTKQSGFNLFRTNIFVPQFTQNTQTQLTLNYPFDTVKSKGIQSIEKNVDAFFDNPAAKWSGLDINGVYMFSDQTQVIKYYETNVLEYSSYNTAQTIPELSNTYNAANQFLKRDSTLTNDIFLTNITSIQDGYIFHYDYYINNTPILMSKETKEKTGMNHAIELTITNNTVRKYKRYMVNITTNNSKTIPINVDFLTALNNIITDEQSPQNIEDIKLGYNLKTTTQATLHWFIKTDKKTYEQAITKEGENP